LLASLFELADVNVAHALHRTWGAPHVLPLSNDGLNVTEAEAHLLQLADPTDAERASRA
jgi:hypothetical protein